MDFLNGYKPQTFVLDIESKEFDSLYILALDNNNWLWIFFAKRNKEPEEESRFTLIYHKDANAPHPFTQKTYFTHHKYTETFHLGYKADCFDIYFCSSILSDKFRGYVGRINTCRNATYPVIITQDPYDTQCSAIAIDSRYHQVIVGYDINSNKFEGIGFETTWEPRTIRTTSNVAIVAYPLNCNLIIQL